MKVYQILPIAMISMGLIACGGGSGSNNDSTPATPIPVAPATNNTADQAKAKAEAEAKAKAEAEAKAKAEAEAKKKAEEAAKAKAEAEAKANQEQLNKLKEQALVKGLSQAEADKYAENSLNKIDAIAKANLDKAIADKALKDRAITVPTINGVKVHRNIAPFNTSALESGKSATTNVRVDGKPAIYYSHNSLSGTSSRSTGYVVMTINTDGYGLVDGKRVKQKIQGYEKVYFQPYSVVYGTTYHSAVIDDKTVVAKPQSQVDQIAGYAVTDWSLPKEGKATYQGKYFLDREDVINHISNRSSLDKDRLSTGFSYTVDFTGKVGYGSLAYTGDAWSINGGVSLEQGVIEKLNIDGVTTYGVRSTARNRDVKGTYELGLFGPNAEEVAGRVKLDNYSSYHTETGKMFLNNKSQYEIGFAGQRGEITK